MRKGLNHSYNGQRLSFMRGKHYLWRLACSLKKIVTTPLLKSIYSVFNNLNRILIARKAPDVTMNIHHTDFFMGALSDHYLDYFVTARKEIAVKAVARQGHEICKTY